MKKRHPFYDFLLYHSCDFAIHISQKISNLANRFAVHIERFATYFSLIQSSTEIKRQMNLKWLEEMKRKNDQPSD